jgi:hypothetical protein
MSTIGAAKIQNPETEIAILHVQVKNIEEKISDVKDDIKEIKASIQENSERQMKLLEATRDASEEAHSSLSKKISALEKWRWMMMGAGIVIGSLGFDTLSKLLK